MPRTASKPASALTPAALLKRAKSEGTPLIDGETATFVWEAQPDTPVPVIIGDFNLWGDFGTPATPLTEAGKGVYRSTVTLAPDAYIEYFFTTDPDDREIRIYDPLNQRRITNGMGKFNNYFQMPQATHTPLVKTRRGVPQGTVTRHELSHFMLAGGKRTVWLYAPPVEQAVPLLLVYDGKDYLRRARLPQIVDNLIAQGKIEPVALALVDNARASRFVEYNAGETALLGVMNLVVPLARAELNLLDPGEHPGAYGVLGASMGGLMALYTGLRVPSVFGKVISQSGSFLFHTPEYAGLVQLLVENLPVQPLTIWQDVGQYEWLLATNRALHTRLTDQGYRVSYREYPGGHNYTSWRDQLPDALIATFGKLTDEAG